MAEPYLQKLTHLISSVPLPTQKDLELNCKHFFSGAALYANGKICATLTPVGFGLKVPPALRTHLFETGRGKALRYFENAPIKKEYALLSPEILADPLKISPYLAISIEFVVENTDPCPTP